MKMFLMNKSVTKFFRLPLSRKLQAIANLYYRKKTSWVYRFLLSSLGQESLVRKPLFLSLEAISLGSRVVIWDGARIEAIHEYRSQKFSPEIFIGEGVTIEQRVHITAASKLIIGKDTMISIDVMIQDTEHGYSDIDRAISAQSLTVKQTIIGSNCLIGAGVKVLAGTKLGNNCIVGANSVLKGEYPNHCIIVGAPAKIVKKYDVDISAWRKVDADGEFL
ncbi:acyltransferase [Pseudoalteromonas sp. SCSIO_11900]|uniref:acyltransferase n=1 Tax=Pseudoalteromonas sp. SCSIO_11900 TaxID=1461766 RepID=UPI00192A85BD|nr:acyltransferase [Pseudoalteromonas sp. SCSIO_11900]